MRLKALPYLFFAAMLGAQTPTSAEQELLDLLNTPVTVASAKAMTIRESPGVLSIISKEEITATGARDIIDVLRLVPGFQFAYDTQGSAGLNARSFWAYEGKALILWGDIELNELLYGTTTLSGRFPVDQIKRIEIIRGPGSAMYGGSAELAVIKIIPMDYTDVQGVAGSTSYSSAQNYHSKSLDGMYAAQSHGFNYTVGAHNSNSPISSATLGYLNISSDSLTASFEAENMIKPNPDAPLYSTATTTQWVSQNLSVKYMMAFDDLMLIPYVKYNKSIPWVDYDSSGDLFRRQVARTKAGFTGHYTFNPTWGLGFGAETSSDDASISSFSSPGHHLVSTGASTFTMSNVAEYAELTYSGVVNFTAGGRYEHNSVSGNKFVPRLALTKAWNSWYTKLLFAEAFRTPDVLNIGRPSSLSTGIQPETTKTYELEIGNQFGASIISGNVYWSKLEKPLVWRVDGYYNGPEVQAAGAEFSYKYKAIWGFLNASYAHSTTDNKVADWSVPGDSHTAVGVAKDQATLLASLKVTTYMDASVNATYLSKRLAYDPFGSIQEYPAGVLLNSNLTFNFKPFTVMVGAYDILNKKAPILSGYNNGVAPLATQGFEGIIKVKYGF